MSCRGIVCGQVLLNLDYTVIHCLWNWHIVCKAEKVRLRYYRPNKNSTLFMTALLVGIEMVNTQSLTSKLKQIDHDMQTYFDKCYRKWSTNIHQFFIRLSVPQTITLLTLMNNFTKSPFSWIYENIFCCMTTKLFDT